MSEQSEPTDGGGEARGPGRVVYDSLAEVGRTFVHLIKAPRALWGINISYLLEGLAYFGVLTILGKYLSEDVGMADLHAGWVYSIFTGGITFSMLLLGGVADRIGIRRALLLALGLMVAGRAFLGASGTFFDYGGGPGSPMFWAVLAGLLCVVVGYGMYQPAAYAGVKAFTNKKTAAIGYAMIYALMNLGAFFSGILSPPVRQAAGMVGVYWVFTGITILAFLSVLVILTRRVVVRAQKRVAEENARFEREQRGEDAARDEETDEAEDGETATPEATGEPRRPLLEPVTIALVALLLAAAAGLGYRAFTADEDPIAARVQRRTAELVAVARGEDAGAARRLAALLSGGVALDTEAEGVGLAVPDGTELTERGAELADFDESAFALADLALRADAAYAGAAGRRDSFREPHPELDDATAHALRDVLRSHAVTTMAAAYGLTNRETFDRKVVEGLRVRLKQIDEERIPMSADEVARANEIGALRPAEMLGELADFAARSASRVEDAVRQEVGAPLAVALRTEAAFAREASDRIEREGGDLGPVGRDILTAKLLSDATTALAQAGLLVGVTREPGFLERVVDSFTTWLVDLTGAEQEVAAPESFHSLRLSGIARRADELAELLPTAARPDATARFVSWSLGYGWLLVVAIVALVLLTRRLLALRPDHPFHNKRFTFFIFVLIPVQTLFAHNWLTLPYYINRAFGGTPVGDNFEFFSNLNPILIFVLTPLIAAFTARSNPYRMMLWGTLVMAAPTFLLTLPPSPAFLILYIVLMTVGEAMWQPRFLQVIAEIAPEGKTGAYMGIGQLPWFLTKLLTGVYSGWFVAAYVPVVGPQNPQVMWLVYALIAMISPLALLLAKGWMGNYLEQK